MIVQSSNTEKLKAQLKEERAAIMSNEEQERSTEEMTKEASNTSEDEVADSKKEGVSEFSQGAEQSQEQSEVQAQTMPTTQQPPKMVIKLPPRLTTNEIKELAFTIKSEKEDQSKQKPSSIGGLFSSVFGG